MVNEAGLKSLTGSVVIDDDLTYSLTSDLKVDKSADKMRVLTPMVELRRPGADPITLSGSAQMDPRGRSLNSDLTLSGVSKNPLKVQGMTRVEQVFKSTYPPLRVHVFVFVRV